MNSKAEQNPRRRSYVWIALSVAVTAAAFVVAFMQADLSAFWLAIGSISPPTLALAGSALLAGALLAALRLWFIARDVGHRLSARDALLALSVGQVAGAVSVQFFGQIVARSALLSPRGVSAPANIVMVTYERLVAVAISGLMATAGAWYLFGRLAVDLQGGGDRRGTGQAGRAVAETADTACTAGTSFAARIKTLNNKSIQIYGTAITVH